MSSTIDMAALVREHLGALVLFARQWDDAHAEDLAHDTFVRLAVQVRDGETPRQPVAWLYKVVRHAAIDRLRREKHAQSYRENMVPSSNEWFVPRETVSETVPDLAEILDARMLTERLKELPLAEREVIVAQIWGGLTFREIAQLTGRSFSTVRREYHRGIETLRGFFGKESQNTSRDL